MKKSTTLAAAALAAVTFFGFASCGTNDSPSTETPVVVKTPDTPVVETPKIPAEHTAALRKAESYLDFGHFSKEGLRKQLTSEYGEGFPEDAADYAMKNVKADWNAEALEAAISYRDNLDMSTKAIREQLISEYGEQFTEAQADYAVQNLRK